MSLTNDEIASKTAKALADLRSATGRLHELQEYCRHEEVKVEQIQGSLKLVCRFCMREVGYPTKEQKIKAGYIL